MFEEKTYYKLCRRCSRGNISFNSPHHFRLKYTLDKVTKPISGSIGILVFDSIEHALNFAPTIISDRKKAIHISNPYMILLECKVQGPAIHIEVLANEHLLVTGLETSHYWIHNRKSPRARRAASLRQDADGYMHGRTIYAPLGTFSVGAVMPIREVTQISWKN